MEMHDIHEMCHDWQKERLLFQWGLADLDMEYTIGRLLVWVDVTLQAMRAEQVQRQKEADLLSRIEMLEQRLKVVESRQK